MHCLWRRQVRRRKLLLRGHAVRRRQLVLGGWIITDHIGLFTILQIYGKVNQSVVMVLQKVGKFYRAFHGFGQTEFAYGDLILGLSQFTILPQLPPNTMLDFKVVKIGSKIISSLD